MRRLRAVRRRQQRDVADDLLSAAGDVGSPLGLFQQIAQLPPRKGLVFRKTAPFDGRHGVEVPGRRPGVCRLVSSLGVQAVEAVDEVVEDAVIEFVAQHGILDFVVDRTDCR